MSRANVRIHATAAAAPITCGTAVRRLWDYIDGRLPAPAHAEVDAHLATCAGCPPHFDFSRNMRGALAASGPSPLTAAAEAELRLRVRAALQAAGNDAGTSAGNGAATEPGVS